MGAPSRQTKPVMMEATQPAGSTGFDWAMAATSGWLVGGLWLDTWAHRNLPSTLETLLTPWHGVLWSGFLAMVTVLVVALSSSRRQVLSTSYGLSLLGALIVMAGIMADLVWHTLFGIEVDLEALLSPTHLLLFVGAGLMVSGPLRAAWSRPVSDMPSGLVTLLPALLSLTFTLSILTLATQYANPFSMPWPAREFDFSNWVGLGQMLGITAILLQAGLLMGVVLLAVRRWDLPFGAITLIFTLNISLSIVPYNYYLFVPVAVLSGLAADLLLQWLKPSLERPGALRMFAFSVPAILYALYFLALILTRGIWWSADLWAGSIVLAGFVGLLLSYLLVPPAVPTKQRGWERPK